MARLLNWPDVGLIKLTPITGPSARNSGVNTASDGSEQVFAGIGDRWAFSMELPSQRGRGARRTRGTFNAGLAAGANAIRWKVYDRDRMSLAEAGLNDPNPQPWSNGENWSNGRAWQPSRPVVPAASAAAVGDRIVSLGDQFWGHQLGLGDWLGFFPLSFGLYEVGEVIAPGTYRIWPPLRTALTTDHHATLDPTIVLKLTGPGSAKLSRGPAFTEGQGADLVEVIDADVRAYYGD